MTTFPVVAPLGTVATISSHSTRHRGGAPLNFTGPPCLDPKFVPGMDTAVPTDLRSAKTRDAWCARTVKLSPLLFTPLGEHHYSPSSPRRHRSLDTRRAPTRHVAVVPLNSTVLVPWLDPKFVSVMSPPPQPLLWLIERLVMLGAATTVKLFPCR